MGDDGRKMIYPITTTQQLRHFPFKFHWKYFSRFREMLISAVVCIPIFYYLQKVSFTPSNVKKYETYLKREEEEYLAHLHHLEGYYEDRHGH